jgi:hypothetical protein
VEGERVKNRQDNRHAKHERRKFARKEKRAAKRQD